VVLRRLSRRACVGDAKLGNVFWTRNCSSDCVLRRDSRFRHGVVARIKVLAVLLDLAEDVLVGGELAVETEELLLLLRHGADVDLLALKRKHGSG